MPSWKKVITSGSAASLSSLTTSGNISGSSTSTGSFGALRVDDTSFNVSADRVGVGTSPVATSKMHIYGQSGAGTEVLHLQHGTYGTLELAHGSPAYGSGKLAIHSAGDLAIGGAGTDISLRMVTGTASSGTANEVQVQVHATTTTTAAHTHLFLSNFFIIFYLLFYV